MEDVNRLEPGKYSATFEYGQCGNNVKTNFETILNLLTFARNRLLRTLADNSTTNYKFDRQSAAPTIISYPDSKTWINATESLIVKSIHMQYYYYI